jgi:hypothetical protein
MEEIVNSIIYGRLEIEIPPNLTLRQQLEVVRALTANPSAKNRIKLSHDVHPWVSMLVNP